MTNHCWYTVKIDVENAFNTSFVLPTPSPVHPKDEMWNYPASKIFSSEWLEYTKSVGINFKDCFVFHRRDHVDPINAHSDYLLLTKKNYFGFNWVLPGASEGSKMIWYEIPDEKPIFKFTSVKTPYVDWPASSLTPIEEYEIKDKLTLVKVAVPHEIYNVTGERWSISARIESFDNISWDQMVDNLRKQNLLVEREV